MLPRENRLRHADEFRAVVRSRGRSRGPLMSVCVLAAAGPLRLGLVVPRSVGNAVVRNRVRRQVRHLFRERLDSACGYDVVVRVHPDAAEVSQHELATTLADALRVATGRAVRA